MPWVAEGSESLETRELKNKRMNCGRGGCVRRVRCNKSKLLFLIKKIYNRCTAGMAERALLEKRGKLPAGDRN